MRFITTMLSTALAITIASPAHAQLAPLSCPQTSTPTTWSGTYLDTNTTKNGVVFDTSSTPSRA